jgi:hypothetical protein
VIVFRELVTVKGRFRIDDRACKTKCSKPEVIGRETAAIVKIRGRKTEVIDKIRGKRTAVIVKKTATNDRKADKKIAILANRIVKTIATSDVKTGRTTWMTTMGTMAIGTTATGTETSAIGGTTCGTNIPWPRPWESPAGD